MYLSVRADDDLSQMVVHGGHGLADTVQSHVHLSLHPVTIGEQTNQLHHNLDGINHRQSVCFQPKVSGNVSKALMRCQI